MKTILSIALVCLVLIVSASDKYLDQMTTNIGIVYKAQTAEELNQAINAFERIANAEKTKWEPYYYASFGSVMLANFEKDGSKKDSYLDRATSFLDKAKSINPNDSEIAALEGFIHTIRLTVDPASRGPQYSMLSMQAFGKALTLNPNNPRAMALMAQMQYGTAQFFNSSIDEACGTLTKALALFESDKSTDVLAPKWGKRMAEGMKEKCN